VSVLSTEEAQLGRTRALVRTVRFRIGDAPALVQLQAFVVGSGMGYALVGTTGEDGFADAEPAFRSIFDGFRLQGEAATLERPGTVDASQALVGS
jgi:hypothetical protein